ncbi:MAG: permease-like cell division protein FtsX [candidate division FCPU426 bacterium]
MAISYIVREAVRSLGRSKRLNLVSLGAMSMSLMALGLVLVLNLGIFQLTRFFQDKIEVVLFLRDDADAKRVEALITKIKDYPQVASAVYQTREEALESFNGDPTLSELLAVLGENPLPASIRIDLWDKTPENVSRFASWLKQFPDAAEISYGGGDAERFLRALLFVRLAVLVLTAALVLAAVIVIGNIISLMVFARREEISLMRLIGATDAFIRGPFLIWGGIQGILGGLVAGCLLWGLWSLLVFFARGELGLDLDALLPPDTGRQALAGWAALMAAGAFLGLVGSLVSVGRELVE